MRRDYLYIAAALLGLWAFKGCYDRQQQALGAERALSERLLVERARWQQRADSLQAAYRVDTVRLRVAVDRWRTLRDTLLLSDTVLLTRRETVLVARAESAVTACLVTVATCEARLMAADSLLVRSDSLVRLWQRRASPSLFRQFTDRLPWAAGGFLLGRFTP